MLIAACTGRTKLKPNYHPPVFCVPLPGFLLSGKSLSWCPFARASFHKFLIFPGQLDSSHPALYLFQGKPLSPCSMGNSCDLQGEHQV